MSNMIKDLRESIMIDVKDLMNENTKQFMREMTVSIRNDIKVTKRESMNTKKEVQQIILTLNSQPELITQDTTQPSARVEELNYLIEEINVEKPPI